MRLNPFWPITQEKLGLPKLATRVDWAWQTFGIFEHSIMVLFKEFVMADLRGELVQLGQSQVLWCHGLFHVFLLYSVFRLVSSPFVADNLLNRLF